MTKRTTGNITVKKTEAGIAPEGLLVVAELVAGRALIGLLGQLQVDVLEAGPRHFEPLELLAARQRPAGQLVQGRDRSRRLRARPPRPSSAVGDRRRLAARGRRGPRGCRGRRSRPLAMIVTRSARRCASSM